MPPLPSGLLIPALALSGALVWQLQLDVPMALANLVSNFAEELVGRGVLLALLLFALGRDRTWLAYPIAAALFCQGHLHYPPPLLAVVFVAGVFWCWLTVRYRSIWPAWGSHMVADVVGGLILPVACRQMRQATGSTSQRA